MYRRVEKTIKGIYVSPGAIEQDPYYANKLVNDHGINMFVIRCGFDPAAWDPAIGEAAEIVSRNGAEYWLLAGTWWGHSPQPQVEEMRSIVDENLFPLTQSFEAQFPMKALGGAADAHIAAAIEDLCRKFAPAGICLTHSRFRSAAYLPGLFQYCPGALEEAMRVQNITPERLSAAFAAAVKRMSELDGPELLSLAQDKGLGKFLESLAGESIFAAWFELRESVLAESIRSLRDAVKAFNSGNILFGSNLYDPFGAPLCGQSYERLDRLYDFVQPLLSYMLWHIYEPVAALSKLLITHASKLAQEEAVEIACRLFDLEGLGMPTDVERMTREGEGAPETITNVIGRAIQNCKSLQNQKHLVTPVIRGRTWPSSVSLSLADQVLNEGFDGVIFQGTEAFAGEPPGDGWY